MGDIQKVITLGDVANLCTMIETSSKSTPYLRFSRDNSTAFINKILTEKTSIILMANGGYIIAVERPSIWYEKKHTQILLLDADDKSICEDLVKECLEWWGERRVSLAIIYTAQVTTIADQTLLEYEFENNGTMLVRRRYGNSKRS